MYPYEITGMIVDDEFDGEEYVTAEFLHEHNSYSITFKKADLEVINAWVFNDGSSLQRTCLKRWSGSLEMM
ncbi:hypothetical protein LIS77_15135 [Cytobacillus firmus]|uniref:hypothetical protein n=1 Tax=Cytobacillus firmus TaxID=1399 RepID=UPI00207936AC|nr:hypothetical protein [Cytobacillus firmus]USK37265.1 hypothetical protein LIS77_15135 [Cytobacillus firmus]